MHHGPCGGLRRGIALCYRGSIVRAIIGSLCVGKGNAALQPAERVLQRVSQAGIKRKRLLVDGEQPLFCVCNAPCAERVFTLRFGKLKDRADSRTIIVARRLG